MAPTDDRRSDLPPWVADPIGTGRSHILVVDDEKLGARRVGEMIAELGPEVSLAHEWTDALKIFLRGDVDLVLMDALMPKVDGFKLTRIIRERSTSYVPILFLTGLSDQDARRRCIEAGADDLLTKPVDAFELRMRLTAMLRVRRLTRALEDKSRELERLATIDTLTGLGNRRMLDQRLDEEVARARRYKRDLSFLMLDIDHFKRVNDTCGHAAGDDLLSCMGRVLTSTIRVTDRAYRYGGEELVVLAPDTSSSDAVTLAERVRREFHEQSRVVSIAGAQTVSVGVAVLSDLSQEAKGADLQRAADTALYAAKEEGRDRVCVWLPTLLPPPPDDEAY